MLIYNYTYNDLIKSISKNLIYSAVNINNFNSISKEFLANYQKTYTQHAGIYNKGTAYVYEYNKKNGKQILRLDEKQSNPVTYTVKSVSETCIQDKSDINSNDIENRIRDFITNVYHNDFPLDQMINTSGLQAFTIIIMHYCTIDFKYVVSYLSDKFYFVYEPIDSFEGIEKIKSEWYIDTTLMETELIFANVVKWMYNVILENIRKKGRFRNVKYTW